jgi:hypothetical protein
MKYKRGYVREDGMIFFRYLGGYESWKTKDAFEKAVDYHRKTNLKSHHKNKEARYLNHKNYIKSIEGTDKGIARKISVNIRSRLRKFVLGKGSFKNIGCSWNEYIKYLEVNMLQGMTWENYGKEWHIDHIVPLSKFNMLDDEEVKIASHFLNTKPMWAKDNIRKSNRVDKTNSQIFLPL